jgi:hypothetical protein
MVANYKLSMTGAGVTLTLFGKSNFRFGSGADAADWQYPPKSSRLTEELES